MPWHHLTKTIPVDEDVIFEAILNFHLYGDPWTIDRLADHATDKVHQDYPGLALNWYMNNVNRLNDVFDEVQRFATVGTRILEARLKRGVLFLEFEVNDAGRHRHY